jgi:DNA-binding CsgD family transcriptional regulator
MHRITPRRRQVLLLAARGYSDREIGEQLGLSAKTVQMHRQRALLLLRLNSHVEVLNWADQEGLDPELSDRLDGLMKRAEIGRRDAPIQVTRARDLRKEIFEQHASDSM